VKVRQHRRRAFEAGAFAAPVDEIVLFALDDTAIPDLAEDLIEFETSRLQERVLYSGCEVERAIAECHYEDTHRGGQHILPAYLRVA